VAAQQQQAQQIVEAVSSRTNNDSYNTTASATTPRATTASTSSTATQTASVTTTTTNGASPKPAAAAVTMEKAASSSAATKAAATVAIPATATSTVQLPSPRNSMGEPVAAPPAGQVKHQTVVLTAPTAAAAPEQRATTDMAAQTMKTSFTIMPRSATQPPVEAASTPAVELNDMTEQQQFFYSAFRIATNNINDLVDVEQGEEPPEEPQQPPEPSTTAAAIASSSQLTVPSGQPESSPPKQQQESLSGPGILSGGLDSTLWPKQSTTAAAIASSSQLTVPSGQPESLPPKHQQQPESAQSLSGSGFLSGGKTLWQPTPMVEGGHKKAATATTKMSPISMCFDRMLGAGTCHCLRCWSGCCGTTRHLSHTSTNCLIAHSFSSEFCSRRHQDTRGRQIDL